MRFLPTTLTLCTLGLVLSGCPLVAGIDHDYSAGPTGPDGSDGTDGSSKTDGSSTTDSGLDGSRAKDGTVATDARTDTQNRADAPRGPDGATVPDSSPHDVTPPPVDACTATCTLTAPPGWTLIGFDATGTNSCPTTGFTQTSVRTPGGSGSCACSTCATVTSPGCETGTITSKVGGTGCTATGESFDANNGNCNPGAVNSAFAYGLFTPPGPTAGTCTATATPTDPTFFPGTMCQSSTTCGSSVCGLDHAMFKTCLYQLGAQTCPSGMTEHVVGSSITTSCDTCTCTDTATSCDGTFSIYSDGQCTSLVNTVQADGTSCEHAGAVVGYSYKYSAFPAGESCSPGTANPTTICCP
jgi:hypothetical protein